MGLEKGSGNSERWVLEKDHGAGPTLHENFRVCAEMRSYKISLVWLAAERIPAYSILFGAPCSLLLPLFFFFVLYVQRTRQCLSRRCPVRRILLRNAPFFAFPELLRPGSMLWFSTRPDLPSTRRSLTRGPDRMPRMPQERKAKVFSSTNSLRRPPGRGLFWGDGSCDRNRPNGWKMISVSIVQL